MSSILVFDPGESTGWVLQDNTGELLGGTAKKNHLEIAGLIERYAPDVVVLETFHLYPGMAKSLSWNSFYPVEVIGVIKYLCMRLGISVVEQSPSIKRYAGGFDARWYELAKSTPTTEHTKDAYLHLKYYLLRRRQ